MCIYNTDNGTRSSLIAELNHMLPFLDKDEAELRALTEGTVEKLKRMTDKEFAKMELISDYDKKLVVANDSGIEYTLSRGMTTLALERGFFSEEGFICI